MSQGTLSGRLALVTGGGQGIGRALSKVLAREGARVVVTDINEPGAKETAASLPGEGHAGALMDVTSEEGVAAVISFIQEKYGAPATIVVNCAGLMEVAPLCDMSEAVFTRVIDINLKGTFFVCKLASSAMIAANVGGSIVNIGSMGTKRGFALNANYTASKAGVCALTRTAAKELGSHGIRCNAVMPGPVDTPLLHPLSEEERIERMEMTVLKRLGRPEEIAEVIAFLASDRASYMTGASVEVSGGITL